MIKAITSKDNPKIKYACSLKQSKYRNQYQEFLGESYKSLLMAIEANLVKEVFTYEYLNIDKNIPQNLVNEEVMKKLSSSITPEGVVFIAKFPTYIDKDYSKLIYLDKISDPGNMGTIIRTALAFNFDAIICSKECVSIFNEKVLSSCKGANYKIPIIYKDLKDFKHTHKIIASTIENNAKNIDDITIKDKFVLVIGNEAHGISVSTKSLADIFVKIPIENIDSINAGVAAGILMYKLR